MVELVVLSTAATVPEAEKIAQALVKERLAACVNLLPQIDSRYWWKGKIEAGQEVLIIIKTVSDRFAALEKRIKALHSYEVPEILALPVVAGNADYQAWLRQYTRPRRSARKK